MTNKQAQRKAIEAAELEAYKQGANDQVRMGLEELHEYLIKPGASVGELLVAVCKALENLS